MSRKIKGAWIAIASCVVTLGVVLIALNLTVGEKNIERQLERLYSTEDPQFRRAMGVLLGPQFLDGNKTEVLLNGDQIFPAMLQAIRKAQTNDHLRDLHLLVGVDRQGVRRCAAPSGRRPASTCTFCSIGWAARRWKHAISRR